jgi:ADP-ribose pyrophosphatase
LNKPEFASEDVNIVETATVFDGFFRVLRHRLKHRLFAGGWSKPISREVLERGDAVAVLPYDPASDRVGLIEQFRVGALKSAHSPWCIEVIAGMLDPGFTPEEIARKELVEEAGVKTCELNYISTYFSSPGGCSEQVHLYCALCDLSNGEGIFGLETENEDIRFKTYTSEEIFNVMYGARTNNSATLIALQWLQLNRARIQHEYSNCY